MWTAKGVQCWPGPCGLAKAVILPGDGRQSPKRGPAVRTGDTLPGMNANLILLTLCQGLFFTNNVTFIAINGLVGLSMAPLGWMATLPVMGYVVGGALSTGLVAKSQSRWGRKVSFQLGLGVALFSALLAAYAAWSHNFWLLVSATVIAGYYSANGQLYRFAAAELSVESFREKAVSLVMAGGLIGAIVGPNLASRTKGILETPFMGAYLALAGVVYRSHAGFRSGPS